MYMYIYTYLLIYLLIYLYTHTYVYISCGTYFIDGSAGTMILRLTMLVHEGVRTCPVY